ncbi:MAG: hypothetical protein GQ527_04535 [Bacteroidales bacterium]|nr:hypothetical protein [Bacteroidales bacterium]
MIKPQLEQLLFEEHSRRQADFIVEIIKQQPLLLISLLEIIKLEEEPISRRAAWPLKILFENAPEIVNPYLDQITSDLKIIKTPAILRSFLSIIAHSEIKDSWYGFLLQYSSETILDINSEIAVKANCLDIFFQIAQTEVELFHELEQMIEHIYPESSRGIQNKCRNILKGIEKIRLNNP